MSEWSCEQELDMDSYLQVDDMNPMDDTIISQLLSADNAVEPASHSHTHRCHIHPDTENCLCQNYINDFGFKPEDVATLPPEALEAEHYANFAKWIPRYKKPEKACDYCHMRGLDCYFTRTDQEDCSCCKVLFRQCSFSHQNATQATVMDTLHSVNENSCIEQGSLTGKVALRSWDRSALDAVEEDDRSRKSNTRFSRASIKVLKDWMEQHQEHPYPTEDEKQELGKLTNLKPKQINDWMANTRRRTKVRTPRGVSPAPTPRNFVIGSAAIDIPFDKTKIRHNGKTWDHMKPLERYLESPPENEPAPITIIAQAADESAVSPSESSSSSDLSLRLGRKSNSSGGSGLSIRRPPSITSLGTALTDSLRSSNSCSNLSLNSSHSRGSRNSLNSLGSGVRKERRRRRRTAANPGRHQTTENRPFHCTFCTDSFRTKYDWARHEKSLHISLEKWVCSPIGAQVVSVENQEQSQCVFCGETNPTNDHIQSHNYRACEEKGIASRTFFRKDHLRQHLRLVHGCKMIDSMESWKIEANFIRSRCGFCAEEFTSWSDRVEHLAVHFKAGMTMAQWKGCRGLDPDVAAQITNAMPPYLIGNEAKSPFPFSASNGASMIQQSQYLGTDLEAICHPGIEWPLEPDPNFESAVLEDLLVPPPNLSPLLNLDQDFTMTDSLQPAIEQFMAEHQCLHAEPITIPELHSAEAAPQLGKQIRVSTCWEILTLRLGKYVRDQMAAGVIPTDAMLQQQARWILFEDDDAWNQTAADNREWLELFKRAHGLVSVESMTDLSLNQTNLIESFGATTLLSSKNLQFEADNSLLFDPRHGVTFNSLGMAMPAGSSDSFAPANDDASAMMTDAEAEALLAELMPIDNFGNIDLSSPDAFVGFDEISTSVSGNTSPFGTDGLNLSPFLPEGDMSKYTFTTSELVPNKTAATAPSGLSALFGNLATSNM